MTIKDIKDKELYINKAREAEKKYNIPENTLVGLLAQESGHFNKDVISGKKKSYAGAIGIGQFMPKTAQFYKIDPLNVDQAIDASAKYLASSFNTFKNWDDAILSYNAGVGRVKEYKAGKPIKIKEHSEYVGRVKNQINRYGAGKLTNPKENITPELTDFDFTTQTPTFALEDSNVEEEDAPKEDKSKEVTQAKEVLKEEQFMSDMFKGKITPIQLAQEEAPQQAPQSNLLESFSNIESFVDTPLAQQGLTVPRKKMSLEELDAKMKQTRALLDKGKVQQSNLKERPKEVVRESTQTTFRNETGRQVNTNPNQQISTKHVNERRTESQIIADRKKAVEESIKAQDESIIGNPNWRQTLATQTQSTGDKFRIFPNEDSFIDNYLNPGVMIGDMAKNLGQAPLQAQQQDSYMPYITSIGTPLAAGAMAGYGTQGNGQFVNNLVNPLAGSEDILKKGVNYVESKGIPLRMPAHIKNDPNLHLNSFSFGNAELDFKKLNPDLEKVGSEAQYEEYLKSNYPDANVLYSGTNNKNEIFEKGFDVDKVNRYNLGFGLNTSPKKHVASSYGDDVLTVLQKNEAVTHDLGGFGAMNLNEAQTKQLYDKFGVESDFKDFHQNTSNKRISDLVDSMKMKGFSNEDIVKTFKDINIDSTRGVVAGGGEAIILTNPEKYNILGSNSDLEGFKKYVNNTGSNDKFQSEIKSAIGNSGMFDMNNPNIYKSIAPIGLGATYLATQDNKQEGGYTEERQKADKDWLTNWYANRVIPNERLQELYLEDKDIYNERMKNVPTVTNVESIDNNPYITGRYNSENGQILMTPKSRDNVYLHEVTHYSDDFSSAMRTVHNQVVGLNKAPKELTQGIYNEKYDYFTDSDEVHARIQVLRKEAGITPEQNVTKEYLDKFLKDYKGDNENINDLLNIADPPHLLEMLNYMASNKDKTIKKGQLAQEGGYTEDEQRFITDYFQQGSQIPISSKGMYEFPNQRVVVPTNGSITMKNIPHKIKATSLETGETKILLPGLEYFFDKTQNVLEVPLKK